MNADQNGLLAFASRQLLTALRRHATLVELTSGQALFRQGDAADALYIVKAGRLEVSVLFEDGRKLTLNSVGPRQVLGEISIFDGGPRTATVEAEVPSTLLKVSRRDIRRAIRDDADIAFELLDLAGRRMRWLEALLEDRSFRSVEGRLARRVLYLLETKELSGSDSLSLSQAELADHVGATRVAVAAVLKSWRLEGIVALSRGRLKIRDRKELVRKAEGEVF